MRKGALSDPGYTLLFILDPHTEKMLFRYFLKKNGRILLDLTQVVFRKLH